MAWKLLVRSLLSLQVIGQQPACGWVGVCEVPSAGAAARPAAGWRGIAGSLLSTVARGVFSSCPLAGFESAMASTKVSTSGMLCMQPYRCLQLSSADGVAGADTIADSFADADTLEGSDAIADNIADAGSISEAGVTAGITADAGTTAGAVADARRDADSIAVTMADADTISDAIAGVGIGVSMLVSVSVLVTV